MRCYGPAEVISEHGSMTVHADLATDVIDVSHPGTPGAQVLGQWKGSVDKRLGGDIHPVRNQQVKLRLPDGREANAYIGLAQLRTDEPVSWDVVGIGVAPYAEGPTVAVMSANGPRSRSVT
jgi:hypothetical protein